ncbi:MAG: Flp pilus assembly protein CpaB [Magnetospirillum sp.]|nr:Flp pilus assembly protein CpaB [Magnetospirillum sp.]
MRPIAVLMVVVAALAAGMAAFLAKRWVDAESNRQAQMGAPMVEVLVAAREIPVGSVLQAADLRYDRWPTAAVTPRLVVRHGNDDPKLKHIGLVARRALGEGEPFSATAAFRQDGSGVMAGMLGPGMRAVSISITNASGVSGFITPGDRVDVVLAADFSKTDSADVAKGSAPMARFAAETVLEDVRVLAIDQQIVAKNKDSAAMTGKTATVEVTAKQAEVLVTAGMMGQLSLVLRSVVRVPDGQAEPAPLGREEFTTDVEASRALQSVRGEARKPPPRAESGPSIRVNRAGSVSSKGM